MSYRNVIRTNSVATLGSTKVTLAGLTDGRDPTISFTFHTDAITGLEVRFMGTTAEARAFAASLIHHADVTDAASQEMTA
jgi:hypothetical protein